MWGGGGCIFIYSCSARRISFKIKFISKEIRRAEHEYMNIYTPPPPINALVTPLNNAVNNTDQILQELWGVYIIVGGESIVILERDTSKNNLFYIGVCYVLIPGFQHFRIAFFRNVNSLHLFGLHM